MKIAIITGASSGLGSAFCTQLQTRGFSVVGIARRAAGDTTLQQNWGYDLSSPTQVQEVCARLESSLAGKAWQSALLINNAGHVAPLGRVPEHRSDVLESAFTLNLLAPFGLSAAFCRGLGSGAPLGLATIVQVSSGLARRVMSGLGAYSAAKAGLEILVRQLALEIPHLLSLGLSPGVVDTPMQAVLREAPATALPDNSYFTEKHQAGALKSPTEVAEDFLVAWESARLRSGFVYDHTPQGMREVQGL